MSRSVIDCYINPDLKSELLKWTRVFQCFIFAVLCTPLVLALAIVIQIWRIIVVIQFKVVHQNKYKIISSTDAAYSIEKFANTMNIHAFAPVKGQTDIERLRNRTLTKIINFTEEDGHRPYQKLTRKLVPMYGFFAWELNDDSFDIRDHVKLCPGIKRNTIYSEQEVFQAVEKFLDYPFEAKRPRWELLFVPTVQLGKGNDNDLHFIVILRVQHAYMDGVSVQNFLSRLCEEPGKLSIDPVNPPFPKPTTIQLIGLYAQAFFMGPHTIFKSISFTPANVFEEIPENTGPKFLGCTNMEISMNSVKLIRNAFKCSTTALLNSVATGALRKAAERKGLPIPAEIDFGFTMAILPYPNRDPQNRFTVKLLQTPIGTSDPVKRLNKLNTVITSVGQHQFLTLYCLSCLIGLLPRILIARIYKTVYCAYAITNLPGFAENPRMLGGTVEGICGVPPMNNGVG